MCKDMCRQKGICWLVSVPVLAAFDIYRTHMTSANCQAWHITWMQSLRSMVKS